MWSLVVGPSDKREEKLDDKKKREREKERLSWVREKFKKKKQAFEKCFYHQSYIVIFSCC